MPAPSAGPAAPAAKGRLHVLSCPPALCPHVEFAAAAALGVPVSARWSAQPALPGALQALLDWSGPGGTAGALASGLRRLRLLRFDVVESATSTSDAERYSWDPDLGLHHALLAASGETVLAEGPLRALLVATAGEPAALAYGLDRLLGGAWDAALEPLRVGAEGAPVSWLRRVG